jgi:hypothetical protein
MGDYRKNPNPIRSSGGHPPVTPVEVDRVRRSALDVVRKNMPNVRAVLDGKKTWSNQQVRLFGMMLNKVMPDLHHSFNEHSIESKSANELTLEELQTIAAQALQPAKEDDEDDTYDAEVIDDEPDTPASGPAPSSDQVSPERL